jgi:hypothetical protein
LPEDEQLKILGELEKRESDFTRLQRARLSSDDFEPLTIIGRGAFGEVSCQMLVCARAWRCGGGGTGLAGERRGVFVHGPGTEGRGGVFVHWSGRGVRGRIGRAGDGSQESSAAAADTAGSDHRLSACHSYRKGG